MTNPNASMLALLIAQAEGQGADMVTLRALVEEASEVGAERALAALGLKDENARRDMDELRELLRAWRDAKKSAWNAVVSWAVGSCWRCWSRGSRSRSGCWRCCDEVRRLCGDLRAAGPGRRRGAGRGVRAGAEARAGRGAFALAARSRGGRSGGSNI